MRNFFVIVLFFSFFFTVKGFTAEVLTETVGQVGDYVVTSREVKISMVIEKILYPSKAPTNGLYEVPSSGEEFKSAVTSTLLEVVVSTEAENFSVANVPDEEVKTALSKVEKTVSGKKYWEDLEVSDRELKKFTLRKLVAKSFLKFKTNSMSSIVTDQEAQAYYDKNRVKFGNSSFDSFKNNIKMYLAQQQLEERLRAWFEVIKRKYKVRNFISG
ncbi:MAG: hypothetical protein ACXVCP_05325 [Bdellovibrio sp.]